VFELTCDDDSKACVSWSGETTRAPTGTDGLLQISGLYGNKLGLKDGEQVTVLNNCYKIIKKLFLIVSMEHVYFLSWILVIMF